MANNNLTDALGQQDFSSVLDTIHQLESSGGKDKSASVINKEGAKGDFQIHRGAFKDVQRALPKKWGEYKWDEVTGDSRLSRSAAGDYLNVISNYFKSKGVAPTVDHLLLGYNQGMGITAGGKITKAGMRYLQRAHELMSKEKR